MKSEVIKIPTYIKNEINKRRGNLSQAVYMEFLLSGVSLPVITKSGGTFN